MSIEQVFRNTTPQYSNLWELAIIPVVAKGTSLTSVVQSNRMRFLAQSCTLPFMSFSTEKTGTGATYINGYASESGFSVDFLETREFTILNYFEGWQDEIFDRKRRVWKTGNHKRLGVLSLLQPTGELPLGEIGSGITRGVGGLTSAPSLTSTVQGVQDSILGGLPAPFEELRSTYVPKRVYLLEGLFPTQIQDIAFDYSSSDQLKVSVSFEINNVSKPFDTLSTLAKELLGGMVKDTAQSAAQNIGQWFTK